MPEIVLATLNAKYPHAAFGLRYLMANLGELTGRAELVEFDISQRAGDVVEGGFLGGDPGFVGWGVCRWSGGGGGGVGGGWRGGRPDMVVVRGGREVWYEREGQAVVGLADYVITGEGDLAFAGLCERVLA